MAIFDSTQFQRPQRYIGNEWNVIRKPHSKKIKICISYPDLYEVGMSNLGLRIIYGLLNEFSNVACERVFLPTADFQNLLQKEKTKLFSLETRTPLDEFEILGFNLNYELNFTNFLHILELGAVPLKAAQRKNIIVIGGGIANPEPLADFVDVFLLGEFEEVAKDFVRVLRKAKNKDERMKRLSEIDGFYVPSLYNFYFDGKKYCFEKKYSHAKLPLRRIFVKNFDKSYVPLKWLTPHTSIIHDRAQVEIARGCPNRCAFCQARAFYHPYRERKITTIEQIIKKIYKNSGYENFSFLALSASDHKFIGKLIDQTFPYFFERKIGLSLPSLRITDLVGRLYKKLAALKRLSLTLAVEAADENLRKQMGKNIDLNEIFEAAKIIRSLKIRHLKVYFMFGFPPETEEDLVAIGEFLKRLQDASSLNINASINVFVPKPLSLWENVSMQDEAILIKKKELIVKNIYRRWQNRISISSIPKSIIEAVISRGDRRLSAVIYRAYLMGAQFDGYQERFSGNIWKEALAEEKIDHHFYLSAQNNNFPWSFIEEEGS